MSLLVSFLPVMTMMLMQRPRRSEHERVGVA